MSDKPKLEIKDPAPAERQSFKRHQDGFGIRDEDIKNLAKMLNDDYPSCSEDPDLEEKITDIAIEVKMVNNGS
ncbi:unnamed protein product [Protopolystoma xenopodis]|uniref:Uncharacterized protein n=1 Tax=Protopolystoma xenopodis TaxID=117903 RepID=A0A3S5A263_9PLAT|nr:unnamed protein product [Protopolystoma xenopodis]